MKCLYSAKEKGFACRRSSSVGKLYASFLASDSSPFHTGLLLVRIVRFFKLVEFIAVLYICLKQVG